MSSMGPSSAGLPSVMGSHVTSCVSEVGGVFEPCCLSAVRCENSMLPSPPGVTSVSPSVARTWALTAAAVSPPDGLLLSVGYSPCDASVSLNGGVPSVIHVVVGPGPVASAPLVLAALSLSSSDWLCVDITIVTAISTCASGVNSGLSSSRVASTAVSIVTGPVMCHAGSAASSLAAGYVIRYVHCESAELAVEYLLAEQLL